MAGPKKAAMLRAKASKQQEKDERDIENTIQALKYLLKKAGNGELIDNTDKGGMIKWVGTVSLRQMAERIVWGETELGMRDANAEMEDFFK